MSDLFRLTRAQRQRIESHFPLSHGVPRVNDLRVVSGILHVTRNGLRWRDATHLKAHHTAASLLKKGLFPAVSDAPRAA